MKKFFSAVLVVIIGVGCSSPKEENSYGRIERLDPALDAIISPDAKIEIIADSLVWSEGPLWLEAEQKLIFSDVPQNLIYQWSEGKGKSIYLKPSGYTSDVVRGGETGSNGLALDNAGDLLLCQHGDRRIARMVAPTNNPKPEFISITDRFKEKKYNSPNDLAVHSSGAVFFTDPPYGLEKQMEYVDKQLSFEGVYVVDYKKTRLLIDSLTYPNGVALSPDEKKMYVAVSDPEKATWYEYSLSDSLTILSGKVFYDATSFVAGNKGLPDGMKVDSNGNIFATGPGGVWIFDSTGKVLGKILVPEATSNCALTPNGKTLFVTNDMYILRIKLRN